MKNINVFISICGLSMQIFAMPVCQSNDFSFQNKNLVLNFSGKNQKAQIYLLHNISKQTFLLDHPVKNVSASAGWASQIASDRWSAILIGKKDKKFTLNCSQFLPGNVRYLSCHKLLQVCQLHYSNIQESVSGSFWLTENQLQRNLWGALQRRGISFQK